MTKLEKCPLCDSNVTLTEDTVGREPWRLEINCPCGLQKLRQPALLESIPPSYATWREQLIAQWNSRPALEETEDELKELRAMVPLTADARPIILGQYYWGRIPGGVKHMEINRIMIQDDCPDPRCESYLHGHIHASRLYSTENAAWAACNLEAKRARERGE